MVLPRTAGDGGYLTKKKKDVENIDTPLWPFRPDEEKWSKNEWYTSRSVGNTEDFGYTYPETEGFSYPATPSQKTKLLETIGNTYDSMAKHILQSKNGVRTAGKDLLPQAHIVKQIEAERIPATAASLEKLASNIPERKTLLEESLKPSKPFLRDLAPNNKYLEWITNIKAEKHTLGGRYTVHVFLGPADDGTDTALWPISPTHVGTFAPLGQPSTTGCGKCQADQRDRTQITGQIPLTIALAERYLAGIISDLGEESVKPYLTENLHWRVVKVSPKVKSTHRGTKEKLSSRLVRWIGPRR